MKTPDDERLFTLAAEEVEAIKEVILEDIKYRSPREPMSKMDYTLNRILARIKQWEEGNKSDFAARNLQ